MHPYEAKLLKALGGASASSLDELGKKLDMGKDPMLWAIENLSKQGAIKVERRKEYAATLTEEGSRDLEIFPEEELVRSLLKSGGRAEIKSIRNGIGFIWAKKLGWVAVSGDSISLTDEGADVARGSKQFPHKTLLASISKDPSIASERVASHDEQFDSLVKRKLIVVKERQVIDSIAITEAGKRMLAAPSDESNLINSVSRDVITGRKWETQGFKPYDPNEEAEPVYPARLHPMHEMIDQVRDIWLDMGFIEVSGPIIESAFWNFDTLFSPQDHPTRDMHDTFFLSNPSQIDIDNIALLNRVRAMHKKGWGGQWREELARKALLRTHTTSVSAHYMKKLSKELESSYPIKIFSVGKVFRNETIDFKHVAELYQADGIIIGNNLTLANLKYVLTRFYSKLGLKTLFKPSYFPFVEPGLEVYHYDEQRKSFIELGGGGIIRKEITKAMGTSKSILAWGLGVDRLMFNFMDLNSLMDMYKNEVDWLRKRKGLKL